MKVILKTDVKDVGRAGDLVNVKIGFARNFLFPRKLAAIATERRIKELAHFQTMAEFKKKKAKSKLSEIIKQISEVTLEFQLNAGKTDKLFGAVTNFDIAKKLQEKGHEVDRRDIVLDEPIRVLGQHKAKVKFGDGLETDIKISVERATVA